MTHTIEVKVDPTAHNREPEPGEEAIAWAALDTAWNLLRETAVRLTILAMREQAAEQGVPFPATDEELFENLKNSGNPEAPTSYLELAPAPEIAAAGLSAAFGILVDQALQDAATGLQDAQDIASL